MLARPATLLAVAVMTAAPVLSACTVQVGAPSAPGSGSAAPVTSAAAAPVVSAATGENAQGAASAEATTASNTAGVWAHTLVDSASRGATPTTITAKGSTQVFPDSTSLWVGCEGTADEVRLALDGKYELLTGDLVLRDSAPEGLVVQVLVLVDGKPVKNVQLDGGHPMPAIVPVQLVVTGARTVTFQSKAVEGMCEPATESYAALGSGRVS